LPYLTIYTRLLRRCVENYKLCRTFSECLPKRSVLVVLLPGAARVILWHREEPGHRRDLLKGTPGILVTYFDAEGNWIQSSGLYKSLRGILRHLHSIPVRKEKCGAKIPRCRPLEIVHSAVCLNDRSVTSSKASSPQTAIYCFLFQLPVLYDLYIEVMQYSVQHSQFCFYFIIVNLSQIGNMFRRYLDHHHQAFLSVDNCYTTVPHQ
jgi:hypothetical protein